MKFRIVLQAGFYNVEIKRGFFPIWERHIGYSSLEVAEREVQILMDLEKRRRGPKKLIKRYSL